jgi:hypothetical protein
VYRGGEKIGQSWVLRILVFRGTDYQSREEACTDVFWRRGRDSEKAGVMNKRWGFGAFDLLLLNSEMKHEGIMELLRNLRVF